MNTPQNIRFRVFDYIEELDCFVVNQVFKSLTDELGITEWHEVVWIGRYFTLDNDYGEHWFDNWEERALIEEKAKILEKEDENQLMIINPERFINKEDGPCHTNEERKQFWHDVLYSLEICLQTLFNECRKIAKKEGSSLSLENAENIIIKLTEKYCN